MTKVNTRVKMLNLIRVSIKMNNNGTYSRIRIFSRYILRSMKLAKRIICSLLRNISCR